MCLKVTNNINIIIECSLSGAIFAYELTFKWRTKLNPAFGIAYMATVISFATLYFKLHSQVTDIWHEHLHKLLKQRTKTPAKPSGIGPAFNSGIPTDFDILGEHGIK